MSPASVATEACCDAVLERLRPSRRPLSTVELRDLLKVRKASLLEALNSCALAAS